MLMKRVRDSEKGILTGFIFNVIEKRWIENWERTCGYFLGIEPAKGINADKAKAYMVRYGAAEDEAEEIIRKDIED